MKINESTLVAFATSSTCPTDKEGWLWKRGEVNKSFQKRYFVLKGNLLFYFEKRNDKEPIGVVILEGCTVELAEDEQERLAFKIVFHGEGRRTYCLGTDCQDTLEEWMKVLASASYDYMKLMVLELQKKLAELEEAEALQLQADKSASAKSDSKRPNPFNKADAKSTTSGSNSSSWAQIHERFGARIVSDRDRWCLALLQK